MKEPNRERRKELRELRKSFMLQLSPKEEGNVEKEITQSGTSKECDTLMLAVTSSTETSTRSSFSSSSGQTHCSILTHERLEATC